MRLTFLGGTGTVAGSKYLLEHEGRRLLVGFHELSTPLTQRHYVRSPDGAMYGIEMTAERLTSPALHVRTPLPGLLLAGQDVTSPGVEGAFMAGCSPRPREPSLRVRLRD